MSVATCKSPKHKSNKKTKKKLPWKDNEEMSMMTFVQIFQDPSMKKRKKPVNTTTKWNPVKKKSMILKKNKTWMHDVKKNQP